MIINLASVEYFLLKHFLPLIYFFTGELYFDTGEWELGYYYCKKSLEGLNGLGNDFLGSWPLSYIGYYYCVQGDIDAALENFQKSLANSQEAGYKEMICSNLRAIGSIHVDTGKYQQALECFQTSLNLARESKTIGSTAMQAGALGGMIEVYLELQDTERVKQYLSELEEVSQVGAGQFRVPEIVFLLTKARVFITSKRFKEKVQAGDILRDLLENYGMIQQRRYQALLYLCDLLIHEVKLLGDETVYQEMQATFDQVKTLAQNWDFAPTLIDVLVLESKLALIEGNAEQAFGLLEQARELAEKKGLVFLQGKVQEQQEMVKQEVNQWKQLLDRNASLQERLELADLESYIKFALKKMKHDV